MEAIEQVAKFALLFVAFLCCLGSLCMLVVLYREHKRDREESERFRKGLDDKAREACSRLHEDIVKMRDDIEKPAGI